MIVRCKSRVDGRSTYFNVTEAGAASLAQDPLGDLIAALDNLGASDHAALLSTLSLLTSSLADIRGARAFGTCGDCAYFVAARGGGYCTCMTSDLAAHEIDLLCASYRGPDGFDTAREQSAMSDDKS